MSEHIGVELRILTPQGVVFLHSSDGLYFMARMGESEPCSPRCLPDCRAHGWVEIFPGATWWTYAGKRDVVVEIRPALLPDIDDPPGI